MKYSDFIAGKYFLSSKTCRWYFWLKFLVSAFIDMIGKPEKFQRNFWRRSPKLKFHQNLAFNWSGIRKLVNCWNNGVSGVLWIRVEPPYCWNCEGTIEVTLLMSKSESPKEHLKTGSNVDCDQHNNVQAPVVQKVYSAIHWINHYPLDNAIRFRYPTF